MIRVLILFVLATHLYGAEAKSNPSCNKYYNNQTSSTIGFILLNHSRLLHEIKLGSGDFVDSLISQKKGSLDLENLQKLVNENQDPYQLAKKISEL